MLFSQDKPEYTQVSGLLALVPKMDHHFRSEPESFHQPHHGYEHGARVAFPGSGLEPVDALGPAHEPSRRYYCPAYEPSYSFPAHEDIEYRNEDVEYRNENVDYRNDPPEYDEWDRALLDERSIRQDWQASPSSLQRLSLPPQPRDSRPLVRVRSQRSFDNSACEAVYNDRGPQHQDLQRRPPSPSLFVHSPYHSSSPTAGHLPSSPSYEASRRRATQEATVGPHRYEVGHSSYIPGGLPRPQRCQGLATNGPLRHPTSLHYSSASMPKGPAPPVVQGIALVPPSRLPDRFKSIFPYPFFNAIQSRCFPTVYESNSNLVLSAPTGSGKTVVLELAVCRLVSTLSNDQFKVIYMAPTKSLCAERYRDWSNKFKILDLTCGELTGDSDAAHLRDVQSASIIVTTPEKWDASTRKWKDHKKLLGLVRLFLIDEVHILRESRGASLEAVVSRMKSVGSGVRFIALSAAVPNSDDIATWLAGRVTDSQEQPAQLEVFGDEFRPIKLQKHVYGYPSNGNDWAFDAVCDSKLVPYCLDGYFLFS